MKKSYIFSALLAAGLGFASCSSEFMELDPVGSVSEGTLSNPAGLERMLASAYATFYSMDDHNWDMGVMSMANWMFGDVVGGDSNKGSTASDQAPATELESWVFDQSNDYFNRKFKRSYEGVKRANQVLQLLDKLGDGVQDAAAFQAEARFIKGVAMFEAIKNFGGAVPYISVEDFIANPDPQVSNHDENGNYIYVWDKVAEDLKFAADNMKETYPKEGYGRPNKYAAKALLAKLYMYWSSPYNGGNGAGQNKWKEAYDLLNEVIYKGVNSAGQPLALVSNYANLWNPNKDEASSISTEAVFDIQQEIVGSGDWFPAGINGSHATAPSVMGGWSFYQPTYDLTNHFIVDEKGLPVANPRELPTLATFNPDDLTVTSYLETYTDPRLDYTVGRFDVPYMDWGTPDPKNVNGWVREVANGGLFQNSKWLPWKTEQNKVNDCPCATNKNFHAIRLAEVYLLYAECCIHLDKLPEAEDFINKVRARAANADTFWKGPDGKGSAFKGKGEIIGTDGSKTVVEGTCANYRIGLYPKNSLDTAEKAMTALKREFRLEMGMEGQRWYNLARWGNIAEELNAFAVFEGSQGMPKYKPTYTNNMVTYPLPLSLLQSTEGRIIQTENWK